jgi:hypothetical protein
MGGGKFVARVYEAGTAEGWKSAIATAAKEAGLAGLILEAPIALTNRQVQGSLRPLASRFPYGYNPPEVKEKY